MAYLWHYILWPIYFMAYYDLIKLMSLSFINCLALKEWGHTKRNEMLLDMKDVL